jgi:4-hydroxymandelate oxidase
MQGVVDRLAGAGLAGRQRVGVRTSVMPEPGRAGGPLEVADVLRLLMGEFEEVMALMGAPTVADFERSGVVLPGGAHFSP